MLRWIALLCLVVCIARRCQIVSSFVPGGCCVALQMLMRADVFSWIKPGERFSSSLGSVVKIYSTNIICKATTVTHTKRIDRNLLRKETSFVCYTSSVLRKSGHTKQKKKLRTVAKITTQDYKNWRLQNFFTIVTPPLSTATTLFNEHRSQRPLGTSDWQNILSAFRVVSVSGDHVVCNRPQRAVEKSQASKPTLVSSGGAVKKFTLQLRYNKLFSFFMLKISSNNS